MKLSRQKLTLIAALVLTSLISAMPDARAQNSQQDYALAAGFYARAQWGEAYTAFRQLMAQYPQSNEAAAAQFFASEALIQQERFPEAFQGYQTFLRLYPQHEYFQRATFRMGESAYRAGRYKIAVRVLEDFVARDANHELNEFALPYLGQIRLKWNEPQLAQRAFETALRLYPASKLSNRCRFGLAKSFQQQGLDAEATRFYEFLQTQFDDELVGESKLQLGIMHFTRFDYDMAEKYLVDAERSCKGATSKAEATYWLSRIQHTLENYDESLKLLKILADQKLEPKLASAVLYDGAIVATKVGDNALALEWLELFRIQYPKSDLADEALRMEIDLCQRVGKTKESLELISQFRSKFRNSPMRQSVLESEGRAHFEAQHFDEAVATFAILLEENETADESDKATWHYLKSLSYMGLNKYAKAERQLDNISTLVQTDDLQPLVEIARASVYFAQEKYLRAIPYYEGYLNQDTDETNNKRAQTELVICYAETKQWEKAATAISQLTERHGLDPTILESTQFVAEKALELGKPDQAEKLFEILSRAGNPSEFMARGLSGLAWCKMESKDVEGAYSAFDRLLTEFPESKFSGEAAMTRANKLEKQNDFHGAAQMYGLVVRRFKASAMTDVARLRRAHALQKLSGELNLAEAKTLLKEYLASPHAKLHGEALYQLGWVNFDLSNPDEGRQNFADLVAKYPECKYSPDAAYRLIQHHVTKKEYDVAQTLIDDLLNKKDTPAEVTSRVLFLNGQIAAGNGNWEQVATAMQQLLLQQPAEELKIKASYWLAESHYRRNQYSTALGVLDGLAEVATASGHKLEPWILLRTSQCLGYENDWVQASEIAESAKTRFPDFEVDYEFDFVLARASEDAGILSDARLAYKRIIKSSKGGSTETAAISQWRIGETYFHQEQYINAINAYYKVDSLFSYPQWRSAALMQAGKCQELLGNNMHALKLYTQLIESFPDSKYAQNAKKRMGRLQSEVSGTAGLQNASDAGSKTRR